jgi:hypothetical protein
MSYPAPRLASLSLIALKQLTGQTIAARVPASMTTPQHNKLAALKIALSERERMKAAPAPETAAMSANTLALREVILSTSSARTVESKTVMIAV